MILDTQNPDASAFVVKQKDNKDQKLGNRNQTKGKKKKFQGTTFGAPLVENHDILGTNVIDYMGGCCNFSRTSY